MTLQHSQMRQLQHRAAGSRHMLAQPCLHAAAPRAKRAASISCAAQGERGNDPFADIKRIAKKIQGALPIVGLVSRLSSPGGGFDEISYPEFCRSAFDSAAVPVRDAVVEMERRYGKLGQSRWLYMMLWMAKHGNGLVPPKNIIVAAKRLRVTQDVEIEMDRFEQTRDATLAKFRMMRPQGSVSDALDVAVDGIATLCMGLSEGQAVSEADEAMLSAVLGWVFPEATSEQLTASIRGRPARVSAYAS
ncbi:hypothetical protein COO60DRAFT_1298202 [Scenedesmus sp. NREL 46B-D3]|nr:hypothetical protein COO60DRAFT_1298202 [Scenedesmus sp. NREL 46B-D3]